SISSNPVVLDGYTLLSLSKLSLPEQLVRIILSDHIPVLNSVISHHLSEFINLTYIDISASRLNIHDLFSLNNLHELHLSACCITKLYLPTYQSNLYAYIKHYQK